MNNSYQDTQEIATNRAQHFNYNATLSFLSKHDSDNFFAFDMLKSFDPKQQKSFSLQTSLEHYIPHDLRENFSKYYLKNLKHLDQMMDNKQYAHLYITEFHENLNSLSNGIHKEFMDYVTSFARQNFKSNNIIQRILEDDFKNQTFNRQSSLNRSSPDLSHAISLELCTLRHIASFDPFKHIPAEIIDNEPSLSNLNPFSPQLVEHYLDYIFTQKDTLLNQFYQKTEKSDSFQQPRTMNNDPEKKVNSLIFQEFSTLFKNSCVELFSNPVELNDSASKIVNYYFEKIQVDIDTQERFRLLHNYADIVKNFKSQQKDKQDFSSISKSSPKM